MKTVLLTAVLVGLSIQIGCAYIGSTFPTAGTLAASSSSDPAVLRRGRALYLTGCTGCHRLYKPHEFPAQSWAPIAEDMGGRASLGPEQIRDLKEYLTAASRFTAQRVSP